MLYKKIKVPVSSLEDVREITDFLLSQGIEKESTFNLWDQDDFKKYHNELIDDEWDRDDFGLVYKCCIFIELYHDSAEFTSPSKFNYGFESIEDDPKTVVEFIHLKEVWDLIMKVKAEEYRVILFENIEHYTNEIKKMEGILKAEMKKAEDLSEIKQGDKVIYDSNKLGYVSGVSIATGTNQFLYKVTGHDQVKRDSKYYHGCFVEGELIKIQED